jgi:uncharacterized protein YndB with AHSA1/START domain
MNSTIKYILIGLAIIIVLPLILGIFVDKEYRVEREIEIQKPRTEVFDYVKHLKNQDEYSVWSKMDPDMEKTFTGQDATVGFISAWNSEDPDVGSGEQEILAISPNERIDFELRFKEPFESTSQAYITTESISDSTTLVSWGFTGRMNYPMNLMLVFMNLEEAIGGDLSEGLANLKENIEPQNPEMQYLQENEQ